MGDAAETREKIAQQDISGVLNAADPFIISQRDRIVALAARREIPGVYSAPNFFVAGGLIFYGTSGIEEWHTVGTYVGRILKMLWGGSGEPISIAALTNPLESRHDETQNQDCERFQPMSRPAGYGRDGDRSDRD